MSGLSMLGLCSVLVGILVVIWGAWLKPIDISSPDFMSFATGGLILLATGLSLIVVLPAIMQMTGIWLAAVATMIYIYSLPDTPLMIKPIGFVPIIALAIWLSLKFWK